MFLNFKSDRVCVVEHLKYFICTDIMLLPAVPVQWHA